MRMQTKAEIVETETSLPNGSEKFYTLMASAETTDDW